jgi:hypothetical protein
LTSARQYEINSIIDATSFRNLMASVGSMSSIISSVNSNIADESKVAFMSHRHACDICGKCFKSRKKA